MNQFTNVLNCETISSGLHEYRKYRGTYGYLCAMENEVIFISIIDGELNCDVLTEFKMKDECDATESDTY